MADRDEIRMNRMYRGDCVWACLALVTLWLIVAFVFFSVVQHCNDRAIILALAGGAGVLLLLNTASIVALIRHYTTDKTHLYGLDIFYIDAMRSAKREAANVR